MANNTKMLYELHKKVDYIIKHIKELEDYKSDFTSAIGFYDDVAINQDDDEVSEYVIVGN